MKNEEKEKNGKKKKTHGRKIVLVSLLSCLKEGNERIRKRKNLVKAGSCSTQDLPIHGTALSASAGAEGTRK